MDFLISVVFVSFKSDKYFRFGLFLRRENFTDFTNNRTERVEDLPIEFAKNLISPLKE